MKWPWVSRKTLKETEAAWSETIGICKRAFVLLEQNLVSDTKLREDLAKQTEATMKLAALLVEIDERFLKQIGVKLPEEKQCSTLNSKQNLRS